MTAIELYLVHIAECQKHGLRKMPFPFKYFFFYILYFFTHQKHSQFYPFPLIYRPVSELVRVTSITPNVLVMVGCSVSKRKRSVGYVSGDADICLVRYRYPVRRLIAKKWNFSSSRVSM